MTTTKGSGSGQTYATGVPETRVAGRQAISILRLAGSLEAGIADIDAEGTDHGTAPYVPHGAALVMIRGANGANGVKLYPPGDRVVVELANPGASPVNIYPPLGGSLAGAGINVPMILGAGLFVRFISVDHQVWVLVGGSGSGGSGGSGAVAGSSSSPPNGLITGFAVGQLYVQFNSSGTAIQRLWVFNGPLGTNTGWV